MNAHRQTPYHADVRAYIAKNGNRNAIGRTNRDVTIIHKGIEALVPAGAEVRRDWFVTRTEGWFLTAAGLKLCVPQEGCDRLFSHNVTYYHVYVPDDAVTEI